MRFACGCLPTATPLSSIYQALWICAPHSPTKKYLYMHTYFRYGTYRPGSFSETVRFDPPHPFFF